MATGKHRQAIGLALGVVCAVLVGALYAADTPFLGSVWLGDSRGITKVDVESHDPLLRIAGLEDVYTLGIDDRAGVIWAFSQNNLHLYSLDGETINAFSAPMPGSGGPSNGNVGYDAKTLEDYYCATTDSAPESPSKKLLGIPNLADKLLGKVLSKLGPNDPPDNFWPGALLVTSPEDGSGWLALENHLYQFSPEGDLLVDRDLGDLITGLAFDTERLRVWASTCQGLHVLEVDGTPVFEQTIGNDRNWVHEIDYDANRDVLWVAIGDVLRRYSPAGEPLFEFPLDSAAYALSVDGVGGAWVATDDRLRRFSALGATLTDLRPISGRGSKKIVAVESNRGNESAWVASDKQLALVDASGTVEFTGEIEGLTGDRLARGLSLAVYSDLAAPELEIVSPTEGSYLNTQTLNIEVTYSDAGLGVKEGTLELLLDGNSLAASCSYDEDNATCTTGAILEGPHSLSATIEDLAGNVSEPADVSFTVDVTPPVITITTPGDDAHTNQSSITVNGALNESATLSVNGETVAVNADQTFSHGPIPLTEGVNQLSVNATDLAGNQSQVIRSVTLDTEVPAAPNGDLIGITDNGNGQYTVTGQPGSVEGGAEVTIRNTRTGETVTVIANADGSFSAQIAAQSGDEIVVTVRDRAGNTSEETKVNSLPPDPAAIAPALSQTEITPFNEAVEFIYTGPNPIQTDVAPGAIEANRAVVIRGSVMQRDGTALGGVTVTIKNHPEFGQTTSRADGAFDMVINGGGVITIDYQKAGFLPAQRQVTTPWQDFAFAPDVALIGLDQNVTSITLAANDTQVARGSVVTDSSGTRQATVIVPAGTTATMQLPDGSTQPLSAIQVRATEYTVGPNGPAAMPGELPPSSAYTYAVEYSADEAIAAGARSVTFNQPLPTYTDNFLGFPIGGVVPTGYYDRVKAAWVPADNGRVIKIVGITNGKADVDVTGSGSASDSQTLASLGITDAEREKLAQLYTPGKSLWRVGIDHFTPWDHNWPYGPPPDAEVPDGCDEDGNCVTSEDDERDPEPSEECNSIIECENRSWGERIPILGTPFALNYRSARIKPGTTVRIPLSDGNVPASLKRIKLQIRTAGQTQLLYFPPEPNQTYTFFWDGKDGYGRDVNRAARVDIRIGYEYDSVYLDPGDFERAFARVGGAFTGVRGVFPFTLWTSTSVNVSAYKLTNPHGLGGWTLNPVHGYDFWDKKLSLGDGTDRRVQGFNVITNRVAGNGTFASTPYDGNGGLASDAPLVQVPAMTNDAEGNYYFSQLRGLIIAPHIRKVNPEGVISTLYVGSGGHEVLSALTTDELGNVYAVQDKVPNFEFRPLFGGILKISPDGVATRIAGAKTFGTPGTGPALSASIRPDGIVIDPQGNIFFTESRRTRPGSDGSFTDRVCYIKKLSADGFITTVAGTGACALAPGDNTPAESTSLNILGSSSRPSGQHLVLDRDGNLYFAELTRIRKVSPQGIVSTVANIGIVVSAAAGSLSIDKSNNLWIAKTDALYKMRLPNGPIVQITGMGVTIPSTGTQSIPDGGAALGLTNTLFSGSVEHPNGDMLIADGIRIRRIATQPPLIAEGELIIPSTDGEELYLFNTKGSHVRTLHARTLGELYVFSYDDQGLISSISDGEGNVTNIERDATGAPLAIVAPDGQRTTLALDGNGYLAQVANPVGGAYTMTYTTDGLVTSFSDPNNNQSVISYDADGYLLRDQNPGGGYFDISRQRVTGGIEVSLVSTLGRLKKYRTQVTDIGEHIRTLINADGTQQQTVTVNNGTRTTTWPDGTVIRSVLGHDPRFGMRSPVPRATTITTPGGRVANVETVRNVTFADEDNPVLLESLSDVVTLNGKQHQTIYDGDSRTYEYTSPMNRKVTTTVDGQVRPTSRHVPGIEAVNYVYDPRGRLAIVSQGTWPAHRTTSLSYGADGYLASITDPENQTTSFENDALGRVTKQTLPDGRFIQYSYDPNGNLTSLIPPGKSAHVFTYTALDQEQSYTPPELPSGTTVTEYTYDLDKQLTQITRPDGQTVDFGYNMAGRLDDISAGATSYDYSYTATGQLDTIQITGGTELTYGYDGFLTTSEATTGSVSGSLNWLYNNDFQVILETVNGANIAFTYDNDGLLLSAGAMNLGRDSQNGLLTGSSLGGVSTSLSYSTFGEVNNQLAQYDGSTLYQESITQRDKLGRIKQKLENYGGANTQYNYSYDLAGRLVGVTVDGGSFTSYSYDSNGNRTFKNQTAATYDAQDRLLTYGNNSYTYTDNGELETKTTSGQTTNYRYDLLGNLRSVNLPDGTDIEYVIDGRNRRIGKKVNGNLVQGFLYGSQLEPIAELDGNNNVVSRFVYASKAHVPDYMIKGGATYRIISDHLGSPRVVVNIGTGQVIQAILYDEFGNVISDSNPGFQPFGFAGGLYDPHTKLTRFGARDYDAETGRWTAKDPIGFAGGDTNLFGYVLADPVNNVDINGKQRDPAQELQDLAFDIVTVPGVYACTLICLVSGINPMETEAEQSEQVMDLLKDTGIDSLLEGASNTKSCPVVVKEVAKTAGKGANAVGAAKEIVNRASCAERCRASF